MMSVTRISIAASFIIRWLQTAWTANKWSTVLDQLEESKLTYSA